MAKIESEAAKTLRAMADRIDEEPLEVQNVRYEKESDESLGELYLTWKDVADLLND